MSSEPADAGSAIGAIAIYGASGLAGRALCAALRAMAPQAELRLVGRSRKRLDEVAASLGEPPPRVLVAAADDRIGLRAAFTGCRVVVSAAGPFAPLDDDVVATAIACGCHYLDVCAEQSVIRRVFERCDAAARHGEVVVVPGAGFTVTLGDLLAAHATAQLLGHDDPGPTVRDAAGKRLVSAQPLAVAVGYLFDELTLSPGAQSSVFANLHAPMVAWRRDRWDPERPGRRQKTFHPGAVAELPSTKAEGGSGAAAGSGSASGSTSGSGLASTSTSASGSASPSGSASGSGSGSGSGSESESEPASPSGSGLGSPSGSGSASASGAGSESEPASGPSSDSDSSSVAPLSSSAPPTVPSIVLSREAFSLGGGDNITIPRHVAAHSVDTYVSLSRSPGFTRALRLAAFAASWLPGAASSVLVPSKTSDDDYAATRFTVIATVEHAFDRRQAIAHGRDLYATSTAITARLTIALARRTAGPCGVLAPAEIVRAAAFLDELVRDGLITLG